MTAAGILLESLKIDNLEKKWAARSLFLLIFVVYVSALLFPPGDPDFTPFWNWVNNYDPAKIMANTDSITLPVITQGNVTYLLFMAAVNFFFVLVALFYSRLYTGEKIGQGMGTSTAAFFRRLPVLLLFFLLFGAASVLLSCFYFAFLFIVPALFFTPQLIMTEKKNPIAAISGSFTLTKGIKLSIFWNLISLFSLMMIVQWLYLSIIPSNLNASVFLDGFFYAYFVLAAGRLNGAFYDIIRIHPIQPDLSGKA